MDKIEKLLLSNKNIFTTQDLSVIWGIAEKSKVWEIAKYYLRKNKLNRIYRGVYSLDKKYTQLALAQKLQPLSYISLHTALSIHGINFQYYSAQYSISLISKKYIISSMEYSYHQVKDYIFFNQKGLIDKGTYILADKERAICDTLYIWPSMNIDTIDNCNKDILLETAQIYKNKRLINDVELLIQKK